MKAVARKIRSFALKPKVKRNKMHGNVYLPIVYAPFCIFMS